LSADDLKHISGHAYALNPTGKPSFVKLIPPTEQRLEQLDECHRQRAYGCERDCVTENEFYEFSNNLRYSAWSHYFASKQEPKPACKLALEIVGLKIRQ
jgi:hypothetical protein